MQNQNHDLIFRVKRRLVEALDLEKRHIAGVRILNDNSANQSIATVILNGRSALISRFGSTEAEFCAEFIRGDTRLASTWKSSDNLWKLSGVFPKTNRQLSDFFNVYTGAAKEMDYCGVRCESVEFTYWRLEEECFSLFSSSSNPYNIEVLSAIFIDNPWTLALRGKRVVIIHPFAETIRSQLLRLRQMPELVPWMPSFEAIVIKAPQTLGAERSGIHKSWTASFELLYEQISNIDFDVALIGCGAYGLPLGARIKQMGKIGIHVGGALQLFFAIHGQRWFSQVSQLLDKRALSVWSWPSLLETPKNYRQIEGGAYWSP